MLYESRPLHSYGTNSMSKHVLKVRVTPSHPYASRILVCGTGRDIPPESRPVPGFSNNRISKDLVKFGLNQNAWYSVSQERNKWRGDCREGLADVTNKRLQDDVLKRAAASTRPIGPFECPVCKRCFSRQQDIARHRCVTTRPRH